MLDLKNKSVALIGYGESNRALGKHLMKKGVDFTVRCPEECALPKGWHGVFGKSYLDTCEDVLFRSPGVRPDLLKKGAYTEIGYALELSRAFKIGVSGSDGKTTTSTLIYRMLTQGGKSAFLGGNIGYPFIEISEGLCESDCMVAELSSFQLMDTVPRLDIAAVTNISQNHLDWHKSMAEYIQAKSNIVKNAATVVLNYDDVTVRGLAAECTGAKRVYFSLSDQGSLVGGEDSFVYPSQGYIYFDRERLFPISDICLRGDFNIQNILCAVGCTYPIVGGESCHRVGREFLGVGGRQEIVCRKNGITYINSAIDTTPTRTKNTLSAFPSERVVAILGGYDKNLDYGCLGEATATIRAAVICGENREKIAGAVGCRSFNVNNLCEAVRVASTVATEGDFVILSPASASFDMFKNYKEKGECFKRCVFSLE